MFDETILSSAQISSRKVRNKENVKIKIGLLTFLSSKMHPQPITSYLPSYKLKVYPYIIIFIEINSC